MPFPRSLFPSSLFPRSLFPGHGGGGGNGSTPAAFSFVDPRAATRVHAPGSTPARGAPRLAVTPGRDASFALQCWIEGSLTPAAFESGDALAAAVYQFRVPAPACTPTVGWYTAPLAGGVPTQTGYDQGQVTASIPAAQTILLGPTGGTLQYKLLVYWQPAGTTLSFPVVELPLAVATPS